MMFDDEKYRMPREWIFNKRKKGTSWKEIECRDDDFFSHHIDDDDYPTTIKEDWPRLVQELKDNETRKEEIKTMIILSTIQAKPEINGLEPKTDSDSCWMCYRDKLKNEDHFSDESLDLIECECCSILRRISTTTGLGDPIRGMVVGNVQSGKTANMAGLIAMAADYGWNFFIILSGTIEKLREQTRDRLYKDLSNQACRCNFQKIDRLDMGESDCKISQMKFYSGAEGSTDSGMRYLTVCLKQTTRLERVLKWLNQDEQKKKQLRILLIDDEADQASVNTAPIEEGEDETPHIEERRKINNLIVKMINGGNWYNDNISAYGGMNYVCYTATPSANFLSDSTPEGLFPRDFITVLTPPSIYLGPKQIFGFESKGFPGMSIFKQMPDNNPELSAMENGKTSELPDDLKDAICWFLYCVCAFRKIGMKKSVSMLIHTDLKTSVHNNVAVAVMLYFRNRKEEILDRTESVVAKKTAEMTMEDFKREVPNYHADGFTINGYVPFEEIKADLKALIEIELQHIRLGEDEKPDWSTGITLCLDNSTKQTVLDTANAIPRLLYPTEEELKSRMYGPAFIVIGGNTLSRGLTLEGLVSTYFTRPSMQADTMMQMGRWFGYRRGYELYPRIWITGGIFLDFINAIDVDEEMRENMLENYSVYRPKDIPPRIRKFPHSANVKSVTSKAKSRAAEIVQYDFKGTLIETAAFDNTAEFLKPNLNTATEFLKTLGTPESIPEKTGCTVWRGIPSEIIDSNLLSRMIFSNRIELSNRAYIQSIMKWIEKHASTTNWNVILAGTKNIDPQVGEYRVSDRVFAGKVERSNRTNGTDGQLHLGFVSTAGDRYADAYAYNLNSEQRNEISELSKNAAGYWRDIRKNIGINGIPVLMIYCISKNSECHGKGAQRFALDAAEDVIALSIIMPGYEKDEKEADDKREYIGIKGPLKGSD